MKKIVIKVIDTRKADIDYFLKSSFIRSDERKILNSISNIETRNEKIVSAYLKNKFIRNYYYNQNGKPLTNGQFFNISHSHGVVVFVMDENPIGIDIELLRDYSEALVDHISSKEEKKYIINNITFFEVWTNKEALVKAAGEGLKSNIKEIPSLPLNKCREYHGHQYFNKTTKFENYIISVSRESKEEYVIEFSFDF